MMIRLLAFALHADEQLVFCKGISDDEEPDLWEMDLTGSVEHWIEVGLPDEKRLRKACGRSRRVLVMVYGGRAAEIWWEQNKATLGRLDKLRVCYLPPAQSQALAALAERTMHLHCTVQEGQVWFSSDRGDIHLEPVNWQSPAGA